MKENKPQSSVPISGVITINGAFVPPRRSRLEEAVKRVHLQNPPFPIRLVLSRGRLCIEVYVPDRNTGMGIKVTHTTGLHDFDVEASNLDDDALRHTIRDAIVGVFMHEFGECYHLDGVRVEDPHRFDSPASGR